MIASRIVTNNIRKASTEKQRLYNRGGGEPGYKRMLKLSQNYVDHGKGLQQDVTS